MNEDIDQVVQRTRQYWFSDGIVELSVGSLFFVLGIYFYLQSTLSPGSLLLITLQVEFVIVLIYVLFVDLLFSIVVFVVVFFDLVSLVFF